MIKDYKTPFNVNGNISYIKSTNYLMSFHLSDFSNLNLFERKKVCQFHWSICPYEFFKH